MPNTCKGHVAARTGGAKKCSQLAAVQVPFFPADDLGASSRPSLGRRFQLQLSFCKAPTIGDLLNISIKLRSSQLLIKP
jgi:hypothetical protein